MVPCAVDETAVGAGIAVGGGGVVGAGTAVGGTLVGAATIGTVVGVCARAGADVAVTTRMRSTICGLASVCLDMNSTTRMPAAAAATNATVKSTPMKMPS